MKQYSLFINCPKYLEYILADELTTLGLQITRITPHGVFGSGDLYISYKICLWSRIANRVHVILLQGETLNAAMLYNLCAEFHWSDIFTSDKTLAIEFHGESDSLRNGMYGAQVIKDGIVDFFRKITNTRPTIVKHIANINLHAYLKNDITTISLDLTGYSLHQRGYRLHQSDAPLKENVAAAILIRANWLQLSQENYALYDPFCGSGTIVIEAALMASNTAPALFRNDQKFINWLDHQENIWQQLRTSALQQQHKRPNAIYGSDQNINIINAAKINAVHALQDKNISFKHLAFQDCRPLQPSGLLICNPPYGERLDAIDSLIPLYENIGENLHNNFQNWQAAILTASPILAKATKLRSHKQYAIYNGNIACKLYCFNLTTTNKLADSLNPGAQMLTNRLIKNLKHLHKWVKRENISCYRLYDADLPEYSCAIDLYNDYAVLQEYAPPTDINTEKAARHRIEMQQATLHALSLDKNKLIIKERKSQKGTQQYQKLSTSQQYLLVNEGKAKFKINLHDYLDVGLFLDHRLLRKEFSQMQAGIKFLNCFCYTATASVHAALSGAITTNVDLSKTYLKWAQENFKINNLDNNQHQFINDDCLQWLIICKNKFDRIYLDPPSFSNSKRMNNTLDIQRDHKQLINSAMQLLLPNGVLYFSTNFRYFKLDSELHKQYIVTDISKKSIDQDFKRNLRIHQCFKICSHNLVPEFDDEIY